MYQMESSETNALEKKLNQIMAKTMNNDDLNQGIVPNPRDGHTACLYKDSMYIFGGDRNKFPYNDLFAFKLEEHNI